jgi:hypothetical protein
MSIAAGEYELMRAWFAHYTAKYSPIPPSLPPEKHPVAVLDSFAERSPATARRGLAMAINDCLEESAFFSPSEVQAADADFAQHGLPTLSALRVRFWKRVRTALERGRIRGEVEYYAVRNAVECAQSDEERQQLWVVIEEFEQRVARNSAPKA